MANSINTSVNSQTTSYQTHGTNSSSNEKIDVLNKGASYKNNNVDCDIDIESYDVASEVVSIKNSSEYDFNKIINGNLYFEVEESHTFMFDGILHYKDAENTLKKLGIDVDKSQISRVDYTDNENMKVYLKNDMVLYIKNGNVEWIQDQRNQITYRYSAERAITTINTNDAIIEFDENGKIKKAYNLKNSDKAFSVKIAGVTKYFLDDTIIKDMNDFGISLSQEDIKNIDFDYDDDLVKVNLNNGDSLILRDGKCIALNTSDAIIHIDENNQIQRVEITDKEKKVVGIELGGETKYFLDEDIAKEVNELGVPFKQEDIERVDFDYGDGMQQIFLKNYEKAIILKDGELYGIQKEDYITYLYEDGKNTAAEAVGIRFELDEKGNIKKAYVLEPNLPASGKKKDEHMDITNYVKDMKVSDIASVDTVNKLIVLSNGTKFQMSPNDNRLVAIETKDYRVEYLPTGDISKETKGKITYKYHMVEYRNDTTPIIYSFKNVCYQVEVNGVNFDIDEQGNIKKATSGNFDITNYIKGASIKNIQEKDGVIILSNGCKIYTEGNKIIKIDTSDKKEYTFNEDGDISSMIDGDKKLTYYYKNGKCVNVGIEGLKFEVDENGNIVGVASKTNVDLSKYIEGLKIEDLQAIDGGVKLSNGYTILIKDGIVSKIEDSEFETYFDKNGQITKKINKNNNTIYYYTNGINTSIDANDIHFEVDESGNITNVYSVKKRFVLFDYFKGTNFKDVKIENGIITSNTGAKIFMENGDIRKVLDNDGILHIWDENGNITPVDIFGNYNLNNNQYGGSQMAFSSDTSELLQDPIILQKLQQYYPYASYEDYALYLNKISNCGCGYTAMINTIFYEYRGREKEFEEKFGFPMYTVDDAGNVDFNYEYLILDYFNYINGNSGYSIQELYGYVNFETSDEALSGESSGGKAMGFNNGSYANFQRYMDDVYGIELSLDERYLNDECNNGYVNSENGFNYEDVINAYYSIKNDNNIVVVGSNDFVLYNMDGTACNGGNPIGGHCMTITGVTADGNFIVSSWGDEYILDVNSIKLNGGNIDLHAVNYR